MLGRGGGAVHPSFHTRIIAFVAMLCTIAVILTLATSAICAMIAPFFVPQDFLV
jgi:hypothetical protein